MRLVYWASLGLFLIVNTAWILFLLFHFSKQIFIDKRVIVVLLHLITLDLIRVKVKTILFVSCNRRFLILSLKLLLRYLLILLLLQFLRGWLRFLILWWAACRLTVTVDHFQILLLQKILNHFRHKLEAMHLNFNRWWFKLFFNKILKFFF